MSQLSPEDERQVTATLVRYATGIDITMTNWKNQPTAGK